MLVKGNGGVSGAVGNTGELFEQSGFIDGADNLRLVDWLQQDSSTIGAGGGSMHLGLMVDGTQGTVSTPQSQIVFDAAGYGTGSIGLLGFNGGGLVVNKAGNTTITGGGSLLLATASGGAGGSLSADASGNLKLGSAAAGGKVVAAAPLVLPSYAFASLPATGTPGSEVFCTNCLKPSEVAGAGTGMIVFDDGHAHWVSTAGTVAAQ